MKKLLHNVPPPPREARTGLGTAILDLKLMVMMNIITIKCLLFFQSRHIKSGRTNGDR